MEPETRYAESEDGASIAYQVDGEGPPNLVFVPGFVSHVEVAREEPAIARFLRRLGSFSRLALFDKRGQGLSDRPGRPPTLEESMDDLKAVMDAAGFEQAAIFGISEGGPMSMLFATVIFVGSTSETVPELPSPVKTSPVSSSTATPCTLPVSTWPSTTPESAFTTVRLLLPEWAA